MSNYNNFGLSTTEIIEFFVSGAKGADSVSLLENFGGQSKVQSIIDDVTYEVLMNMDDALFYTLRNVELEQLNPDGGLVNDTSSLTLGLTPVQSITNIWRFAGVVASRPDSRNALDTDEYDIDITDGVATISLTNGDDWQEGQYVYASYVRDVDDASFLIPSIATIIKAGVVAVLGGNYFSNGDSVWENVKMQNSKFNKFKEKLTKGGWYPPEIRRLQYWKDKSVGVISSFKLVR